MPPKARRMASAMAAMPHQRFHHGEGGFAGATQGAVVISLGVTGAVLGASVRRDPQFEQNSASAAIGRLQFGHW